MKFASWPGRYGCWLTSYESSEAQNMENFTGNDVGDEYHILKQFSRLTARRPQNRAGSGCSSGRIVLVPRRCNETRGDVSIKQIRPLPHGSGQNLPEPSAVAGESAEDWSMKKLLRKAFRPSNRRVRILVGLLLAGLLIVQVAQSGATGLSQTNTVAVIDENEIVTSEPDLLQKLCTLAETDHLALLKLCRAELKKGNYDRYTATFIKQEQIRGQLKSEQHIKAKFMAEPFSVVMTWVKNPPAGNALVYVEGKFPDKNGKSQMLVQPTSQFLRRLVGGSVPRLPDGPDAMRNTLRPCTLFGFENSLESLIRVYENARKNGDSNEQWGYRDEKTGQDVKFAEVDGRKCIVLVRLLPRKEGYPAKKTITFIDLEYLLPVRVIGYDWNDNFFCNYEYRDVDFSAELTKDSFTPEANGIKVK